MNRSILGLLVLTLIWSGCESEPPPALFSYSEPAEHPKAELYPPTGYVPDGSEWISRPERTPENRFTPADQPMGPMSGQTGSIASWGAAEEVLLTDYVTDAVFMKPFVLVADRGQSTITAIHVESGSVEVVGSEGAGPLEFQYLSDVEVFDDNSVLVANLTRVIKTISIVDGEWVEESSFNTEFSPAGMCLLGDRLAVFGGASSDGEEGLIRIMNLDGEVLSSFGEGYETDNPMLDLALSGITGIACFPEIDQVIVAYRNMPIIISFDAEGTLKWVRYLDDFLPYRKDLITGSGGSQGVRHPNPSAGMDLIEDLFRIEGTNGFAVVVSEATEEDPPPGHNPLYELITLDAASGELIATDIGPRIYYASRDALVGFTVYPEPAVHKIDLP